MADKKISVGLNVDASASIKKMQDDFAAAVKKIQQDFSKLQVPSARAGGAPGPGTPGGSPAYQTYQKAFQDSREQEDKIRKQQQAGQIAKKNLEDISRQLATNARLEATSAKTEKDRVFYAQERNRLEREFQTTQAANIRLNGQISGGPGSKSGMLGSLGVSAATIMAGVYAAIKAGSAIEGVRKTYSEAGHRGTELQASAFQMQGQGGQRLNSLLNGGAAEETMFNSERLRASAAADSEMQNRLNSGTRQFTNFRQKLLGKTFAEGGFGTAATVEQVRQEQAIERNQIQQQQYEAMRNGPEGALKSTLGGRYLQNYQRDLDFQRSTGMSGGAFRGAFTNSVTGAGFTQEQGMGMAGGILGAGGSTRAAGNAVTGLQAQRNFDLTNAGSVIGQLSGGIGGSGASKEALVKVLSEGTRIGINQADFVEENRKFVEAAASAITQSGASSGTGIDQVLGQFGKFFGGDKTGTGLEAGKSAYELYRGISMAQTGPTGTMRAAGMLSDPLLGKLGRESREVLFNMPIDQLSADNPAIQAMAKEAGTSAQALIDAQNKITGSSSNKFVSSDVSMGRLSGLKSKFGVSSMGQGPLSFAMQDEMQSAFGEAVKSQMRENPGLAQNFRTAAAFTEARSTGDTSAANRILQDTTRGKLDSGTSGRPEDETNRIQAEASRLANQLFLSVKDSIVPAADAAKNFAKQINDLTAAMNHGTPSQRTSAINSINSFFGAPASNAPSAAAPAGNPGR